MVYVPGGIFEMVYSPSISETDPVPISLTRIFTPIMGSLVLESDIFPDIFPVEAPKIPKQKIIIIK